MPAASSPPARWIIHYADGTTFSSEDGEPHQAPASGFVTAVGFDNEGRRYLMNGWDHYRFDRETGQWWGHDLMGVFDRLRHNLEIYAYKEGRTVGSQLYQEICNRACRAPGWK